MRATANRPIWHDLLLALTVLALAFLNFGHTNQTFAAGGRIVATTSADCGNPFLPAHGDHAPCHVCAIGNAADLPPPPADVEPVAFAVVPVVYATPLWTAAAPMRARPAMPRGPPASV